MCLNTKLAFILCLMLVAGFRVIHLFDLPYLIQQLYGVFYIFSTGIIVFTIWKQKKRNASNLKDGDLSIWRKIICQPSHSPFSPCSD